MIHAVYVIHQLSGVCVLYNKYGTIEFNEDLIAGFLTALKDFSHEVTGGKGNIKVLDMVVYNIHLVFQGGVLIAAASDKKDSREIAQNKLEGILQEFLERYNKKNELDDWSGDVRKFKDFSKFLDEVLEMGLAAEIPRIMPLLKIFEKSYKKENKLLKKGMEITAKDQKSLDILSKRDWLSKKMPKQIVSQGMLTKDEYGLAHICDGFKDIHEIAEIAGVSTENAQVTVEKLKRLDLLKFITL